ncbi:MAG: hypothetical protein J7L96_06035, partial [Bacteroidales bacterium]|nr:hypothetical protein [Bacteroidales bacterium]
MVDMVLIGLLLSLFVLYLSGLLVESEIHNRRLRAVPFRISVTGTRGKTTVVRMVAGILRQAGYTVLAKTTGTEAKYILPDGSEEPIKRIGLPNILEQKKLIKKAAELKVDYLVTEIMSIHPENHYAETHKLIKPHFTIITNFRQDHLDEVTQEHDMDSMYLNDVYPGSRVILHPEGKEKWRMRFLNKLNIKPIVPEVDPGLSDNKLLANSFGESMDIAPETIKEGIEKAKMDRGSTRIYK